MMVIARGVNPSEKYLAALADKAFLKLWSYPNLFIDRKKGSKGDGKEFCDLLVVCGDDILMLDLRCVEVIAQRHAQKKCQTSTVARQPFKRQIITPASKCCAILQSQCP